MCKKTNIIGLVFIPLLFSNVSFAHNKVVVIPMAGDDVVQTIKPFDPVTATAPMTSDYTISSFTVVDKVTQLEWQKIDDDVTRNWNDAFDYCVGLDLDGKTDWRLPTVNELQSIVDYGTATAPSINGVAFPSTNNRFYWSASARASSSSSAWLVSFGEGNVNIGGKTGNDYVRCVR